MELVSICIPTYNSEKYIKECLESVVNQSYKNIEIIISDNNSTDNTLEVIKNLKISNLKIHKNQTNIGMVENFNTAASMATGKYVKLLASDDLIDKFSIEKLITPFKIYKNLVLSSSAKKIINSKSETIFHNISNLKTGKYDGKRIIQKILYSGRNPVGEPSAALIKREIIDKVGGFKSIYPMTLDIDFWMTILKLGDLFYINEPLASFRIQNDSYSVQKKSINEYSKWLKIKKEEGYINSLEYLYIFSKYNISKILKKIIYFLNAK